MGCFHWFSNWKGSEHLKSHDKKLCVPRRHSDLRPPPVCPTQPAALSDKFAGSGIRDSLLSESILAQTDREKVKRRSQYTSTDSSRRSTSTISHSVSFRLSCTDVDHLTPTIRPSPYAKPKDRGVIRRLRRLAESIRLWHDKHGKELPKEYITITPPSLAKELDKIEEEQSKSKRERKNRRLYILQKEKDKQKRKKKAKDSLFGRSPKKVLKPQKSSPKSKDKSGSKGAPKSSKRSPKVPSDFDDGQLTTRSR